MKEELRRDVNEEIERAFEEVQPVTFKTIAVIGEFGDFYETFEDSYPQSSGSDEEYAIKPEITMDGEVEIVEDVDLEQVLLKVSDYSDDEVSQSSLSLTWWMFWTVVFLVVVLSIIFVVRVTTAKRRKTLKKNRHHQQVNKSLTPEERQLLQMQQNGFENPTYKFFEKHQVA